MLLVVSLIAALTLLLPPATATLLNQRRITRADAECVRLAGAIVHFRDEKSSYPGREASTKVVLVVGPGDVPRDATDDEWLSGETEPLEDHLLADAPVSTALAPDPWGNRYAFNVGVVGGALWVISAGPNGIVETAFEQEAASASLRGDDVGARVR